MGTAPEEGFDRRWSAAGSDVRKEIARLANLGETSDDPEKAALVAGVARRRLRPVELVVTAVAAVVAYVAVAILFLDGPEPVIVAGLVAGVVIFLMIQRKRFLAAIRKSEKVLRRASES